MGSTSSLSSSSGSVRVLIVKGWSFGRGRGFSARRKLLKPTLQGSLGPCDAYIKIEDEHNFFIFIRLAAVLTIAYVHISQFSTRFLISHSLGCCRIKGAICQQKFWHLTGWTNIAPRNFILSLRCIAFRKCKACYRRESTGKILFVQKQPLKIPKIGTQ